MSKPELLTVAISLMVLMLVSSCSFYNKEFGAPNVIKKNYELRTVQVDDFGSWWNPQHAQATIDYIEKFSKGTNTYVVLFIHGWHHNADAENDCNYNSFEKTLSGIGEKLASPEYRRERKRITGSSEFKLIGVYVGWRGRSLPGYLDYATMWWRKSAAERVGDGDVSEFIERLHRIYLRANSLSSRSEVPHPDERRPFMGLVSIGHSFGAQVLMKSIARPLEYYLTERAPRLANSLKDSGASNLELQDQRFPIDSFGDINILINPALEAYQFAKIDSLYRQIRFSYKQAPQMVVFSAENDSARKLFFPIARGVTRPFRPSFSNEYQGSLYGKALGEFEPQQTHEMRLNPGAPDSLSNQDYSDAPTIARFDFTGDLSFSGVGMVRLLNRPVPNSPVAVVNVKNKIIDGHNGIFNPEFINFLTKYIDFIEGKNLAIRKERWEERLRAQQSQAPAEW